MEEGVEERPPPPAPRPRSRRMSVITLQEANAEQARAPLGSRRMSVIAVQEANANADQGRTPLSPKRIAGAPSFSDSRRGGLQCSDDVDTENYWRKVLRSADGPFGRAPSENPLDKSANQSVSVSTLGLNTMTLCAVAGSGNCVSYNCSRVIEV